MMGFYIILTVDITVLKFTGILTIDIFQISQSNELWFDAHKNGHSYTSWWKRALLFNRGPSGPHRVGLHIQSAVREESQDIDINALVFQKKKKHYFDIGVLMGRARLSLTRASPVSAMFGWPHNRNEPNQAQHASKDALGLAWKYKFGPFSIWAGIGFSDRKPESALLGLNNECL